MDKAQRSKRKRFRRRARIVLTLLLLLCAGAFGSVLAQIGLSHAKSAGDFSGGGTAYSGGQGSGTAYSRRHGNPGMAHHAAAPRPEARRDGEDQGSGGGSHPHAGGAFGGMPGAIGGGRGASGSGGGGHGGFGGFGGSPGAFGAFSGMGGGGGGFAGLPEDAQAGKSHEKDSPQDGAADGCKDGCESARNGGGTAQDSTGEETPKQDDPGIDLPAGFDPPASIDLPECASDYCAFTPPDETAPRQSLSDTDPGCTQNCEPGPSGSQPQPSLAGPQAVPEPASLLLLAPALLALRRGRRTACRGNLSRAPR